MVGIPTGAYAAVFHASGRFGLRHKIERGVANDRLVLWAMSGPQSSKAVAKDHVDDPMEAALDPQWARTAQAKVLASSRREPQRVCVRWCNCTGQPHRLPTRRRRAERRGRGVAAATGQNFYVAILVARNGFGQNQPARTSDGCGRACREVTNMTGTHRRQEDQQTWYNLRHHAVHVASVNRKPRLYTVGIRFHASSAAIL